MPLAVNPSVPLESAEAYLEAAVPTCIIVDVLSEGHHRVARESLVPWKREALHKSRSAGARLARREERAYRPYVSEEQRRQPDAPPGSCARNHVSRGLVRIERLCVVHETPRPPC